MPAYGHDVVGKADACAEVFASQDGVRRMADAEVVLGMCVDSLRLRDNRQSMPPGGKAEAHGKRVPSQDGVWRLADAEGVPGDARGAARGAGHEQQLRVARQQAAGLAAHRQAPPQTPGLLRYWRSLS